MEIKPVNLNSIKTSLVSPAVFLTIGALKTCSDCKNAPENERAKTFANDITILGSAGVGFLATILALKGFYKLNAGAKLNKLFSKISNKIFSNKYQKHGLFTQFSAFMKKNNEVATNIHNGVSEVIKGCFDNTVSALGGVAGAVFASVHLMPKIENKLPQNFSENKKPEKTDEEIVFENSKTEFISEQISNLFGDTKTNALVSLISDHPELKGLGGAMMSLTAHDIASIKDPNLRFKKATYEIVAFTLIPAFFVSIASVFAKNLKNVFKFPIIIASLLLGGFVGSKATELFKERFENMVDSKFFNIAPTGEPIVSAKENIKK